MLTIPNYQIKEQIYESINSTVYRGIRNKDNQPVILKMLKQDYPTQAELTRYQQEYEIIHDLSLEGVIKVYDIEKYQNTLIIILEDFNGESLKQLIVDRPLTIQEFLPIAIQIADNLANIHAANIIHKDINPSNIVWEPRTKLLKIIDFGIASLLPRENPTLKNPEQLEGTLAYLSPEQTGRINRSMDYRTDLYSLGVTFYELLTGQLPFKNTDAMELVHCHIAKNSTPINEINPEIPQIISDLVMKLLAKNAEDRYQSAFGLKADLERYQENLTGLEDLSGLQFELAQHDFSGKFEIPQKLYGRTNEINTLLQTFDRVSNSNTEMMLVAGYSGVGKTALVHEVHKPMTEKQGYFASGKFDQFQKNIPYSAITQAFNQFCRYLLIENAESLANWQTKILTAVGNNGQIIIDVIPDLELIIGKQPPVAEVSATEAQNRFQMFFSNFIKILCSKEHPFILFIDDLQWIDSASLSLLKNIMLDTGIQYLLIIGAYRDNEVDAGHPFIMAVKELQKSEIIINKIKLTNLQISDVNELLQDTLRNNASNTLADLVYQKTQGNAFFTHQFLHTLYEEELLSFEQQQWHWDITQIAAKNITDNVVELMANKINKLPQETSEILQLAACIGNQFDLPILTIISELDQQETAKKLQPAIVEGLVQPLDEKSQFKFLHDRVQQAAYARIDSEQKKTVHLTIGRLLLKNTLANILEDKVFDIIVHFNHSLELIDNQAEQFEVARLNLIAGKKAKAATAYNSALQYLKVGEKCLNPTSWQQCYDFTLDLYKKLAEIEFLNGNFEQSEQIIRQTVQQVKTPLEKAEVLHMLIVQYTLSALYPKAIQTGQQALALLGIELAEDNFEQVRNQEMNKNKEIIGDRTIASLFDLPIMTNPIYQTAVKILITMGPPCYRSHQKLWAVIVSKVVNLTLIHGNVPQVGYSHTAYGGLLGYVWNDYTTGAEFGHLATRLMHEKFADSSASQSVFCLMIGSSLRHWSRPLKEASVDYNQAYQIGLDSGNLQYAVYAFGHNMYCRFYQGVNLPELLQEINGYLTFCLSRKNQWGIDLMEAGIMVILNIMGDIKNKTTVFCKPELTEAQFLARCEAHENIQVLCIFYIMKTGSLYLHGHFTEALDSIREAEQRFITVATQGLLLSAEHRFNESFVLLALYPQVSVELQTDYWKKIEANQSLAKIWADNCPENYQHRYFLVAAEMACINGKDLEAIDLYDQAIISARDNGFIQNEAIANELAAKFWLNKNKEEFAQIYLRKAYYCYQQWGAIAKVKQLEEKYPQLLTTTLNQNIDTSHTVMSSNVTQFQISKTLDIDSIAKAAQILAGEIVLSKLLEKMMSIVIENAGAERGFLLLPQAEQWFIEAEGAIDKVTVLKSQPVNKYLPEAIISYVAHTQENVWLDNASQEGLYIENSYIKAHQTQSVLCFPIIYQQQLRAILYFENNLTTGAFTPQRLKVLTMLSSQIAISLENAQVMANLDARVKERTTQLNTKVKELTKTRHELVQSEKMASLGRLVAGFAHELNTPLGVAIGSASLLRRKAKQINNLMEQEEVDVDELLSSLESIDKGSDLTLSNLERAANLVTSFKRTAVDQTSDEVRTFHVHQVVNDIINTLNSRFKKTDISIQVSCPDDIKIKSLPGALEQVLTNLLMNSYTHGFNEGKDAGIIQLNVQLNKDKLHLEYSDNGKGIESENMEKIFEPFFTTHRASGGSGLGMYICYNLVTTQLNGTLTCKSIIGDGVMFKIDFPI